MLEENLKDAQSRMRKTFEFLESELVKLRTGRATPALIENIKVKVYDGSQELKIAELGTITTQDAKTLVIQPFDISIISQIEKGIQAANIGVTPAVDGELIRISLPPLSDERRKEYVTIVKQKAEAARIALRNIRRDFIEILDRAEKDKEISEDDKFRFHEQAQRVTDDFNQQIAELVRKKEQEIMQV